MEVVPEKRNGLPPAGHSIVLGVDRDTLTFSVVCHLGDDKPCTSFEEGQWPDYFTCRCTAADCDCRTGDHGACSDFGGYIENVGYECQSIPTGQCWFEHAAEEVGVDMFDATLLAAPIPVKLTGNSWDDPITVEVLT